MSAEPPRTNRLQLLPLLRSLRKSPDLEELSLQHLEGTVEGVWSFGLR